MNRTKLFSVHVASGASLAEHDGWMVPTAHGESELAPESVARGCGLVDLSHVAVIRLTADDVRRWANGMFTNNIKRLGSGRGNRNAMCDDRGRVQGLLDLYCIDDQNFLAVLDGVTADWFSERYRMFLILDDIDVEPLSDTHTLLSLQGAGSEDVVRALGLPVPESVRQHSGDVETGVWIARRDRTNAGGFDLLVPNEDVEAFWGRCLEAGAGVFGTETLDTMRVLAGHAAWPQDGTERSLVHELRLNEEVCAFDKGCYVGQEVINRVDVKGQINKRLTGFEVDADSPPPLGAEVLHGEKVVGVVTSVAMVDARCFGLGVLRKAAWEPGTRLLIRAADAEASAEVRSMPFSL